MLSQFEAITHYMRRRTWTLCLNPVLSEDPVEARRSSFASLRRLGMRCSFGELESLFDAAHCPLCALEELPPVGNAQQAIARAQAATSFWNHTPRADLGGVSPAQKLRERIAERPDEEPWQVASDEDHKIAEFHGPEFFQGVPSPSEFGLPPDFLEAVESQILETSQKTGRNDKCPCGSGRKFKKCCLGAGESQTGDRTVDAQANT